MTMMGPSAQFFSSLRGRTLLGFGFCFCLVWLSPPSLCVPASGELAPAAVAVSVANRKVAIEDDKCAVNEVSTW